MDILNDIMKFELLDSELRKEVDKVKEGLKTFENILKGSISKRTRLNSNFLIIKGQPGIGKTYLSQKWLTELTEQGVIKEFSRMSGKITPVTLFNFLDTTKTDINSTVHVLDDCDIYNSLESINIIKACCELTGDKNYLRTVSYGSRGTISRYNYTGFIIMITNYDLLSSPNPHVSALLDRAIYTELPLDKRGIFYYTVSLIEDHINEHLFKFSAETRDFIKKFYNEYLVQFIEYDVFTKCNVTFSLRYMFKILDLFTLFGNEWTNSSIEFKKMENVLNECKSSQTN